jgi:hypothetical protein
MRLWTLHPKYLDARDLVAVWREGLLAQAVLGGRTKRYTKHPQLTRFRRSPRPLGCIGSYLAAVHDEASRRGYRFDRQRIRYASRRARLSATLGQLEYEWRHLKAKLAKRDRKWLAGMKGIRPLKAHPLFRVVAGGVEGWEVGMRRHRTSG